MDREINITPAHIDPTTGEIVDSQADPISLEQLEGAFLARGIGYERDGLILDLPLAGQAVQDFANRLKLWGVHYENLVLDANGKLPGLTLEDSTYALECFAYEASFLKEVTRQLERKGEEVVVDRDTLVELIAKLGAIEIPGTHVKLSLEPDQSRIKLLPDSPHIYSAHGADEAFFIYAENVSALLKGEGAEDLKENIRAHIFSHAECMWDVDTSESIWDEDIIKCSELDEAASRVFWLSGLVDLASELGISLTPHDHLRYQAALNHLRCSVATYEFGVDPEELIVTGSDGYEYSDFKMLEGNDTFSKEYSAIIMRSEELIESVKFDK